MRTIMHDRRLHFLVPFALPSAADAASSLHTLDSPALEKLLSRASLVERVAGEDFQRTLPHERWLARQFGAAQGNAADEAPLAPYMLLADGGDPGDQAWACVEPVHVEIAHDHLVLVDPAALELEDGEAAALLAVARPLIEELGVRLEAPSPHRWYLSSEQFRHLAGAAPLRASGRNIEIWLPHEAHTGERSRIWMKLQNEVQMAWFQHPVNEAREARGLPAVNSIWFHAQGALKPVGRPFARVLSTAPAALGLARAARADAGAPPAAFDQLDAADGATLVELSALTTPFIEQDWASWHDALGTMERDWFAPALAALQRGELARVDVTLCGDTGSATLRATRGDLRKFWRRRRALASLFE
ncbi:regulator [Burkholderia ubonensis]|nr:regulator [Burkholderia ubonensis]KVQ12823.1 regulator [Burkholderia ubonensis]KVU24312.1 regulator [Burkholderia ubonensis]KVU63453.1 regulator [Burkholderia ubonensis]KVU99727.1 regulator [Burkholderia ubonensis]